MGGSSMSNSFLANSVKRREQLNKVREGLLDRPGTARRGGPPPPTAPAQDRKSPQQKALRPKSKPAPKAQPKGAASAPEEERAPLPELNIDGETRRELLDQVGTFLRQAKLEKRARLHEKIGRTRRFFGGGL